MNNRPLGFPFSTIHKFLLAESQEVNDTRHTGAVIELSRGGEKAISTLVAAGCLEWRASVHGWGLWITLWGRDVLWYNS